MLVVGGRWWLTGVYGVWVDERWLRYHLMQNKGREKVKNMDKGLSLQRISKTHNKFSNLIHIIQL